MSTAAAIAVPERLDHASVQAMQAALDAAVARGAEVIVLEGEAERFCLGMDLAEPELTRTQLPRLAGLLLALICCPRPTLAVIDGPALGGGLGLACACDLVLASERATVGLPEALYGLVPAIVRPVLLTRLAPQKLRLLLLSCHSRGAREALALGLVDELASAAALADARRRAIRQLRRANGRAVAALRRWDRDSLRRQLEAGVAETARALADPAVLDALQAFAMEEDLPWMR